MPWKTKEAQREYNQKYRIQNLEKIRENNREWRKNNRDKYNQRMREWRNENIEIQREKDKIKAIRWRHKNPERHKENVHSRRLNTIMAVRHYKEERGCSQCPEKDYRCLDFHHRDPSTKSFNISTGLSNKLALPTLMKEIEKCDLLCRNCHIKLNKRVYEVLE